MNPEPPDTADPSSQVVALAAGFAHEIKNPLSTIALNVQLLQEDWQTADTPREQRTLKRLGVLQREIARLTHLLEDFLRYARTRGLQPQPCAINSIVQEVLDFIAPQAARQKIEIRTGFAEDLPVVPADPKLLKQAILNLVLNAQDAMPGGGELLAQTQREGDQIRIDITDTGVGIPPNHLGKIFNVYFSTKESLSGSDSDGGYTDIYENLLLDPTRPPYLQLTGSPDLNTGRIAFVKLSYQFRF